jgi:hypothetical protein
MAVLASDVSEARPQVVVTAAVKQAELGARAQPAALDAAEARRPAEAVAVASGARAVLLRAVVAARHAEVVAAAVRRDAEVPVQAAGPAAPDAAEGPRREEAPDAVEALRPEGAQRAVVVHRPAQALQAAPAAVQAADPSAAAWACHQGRSRPAVVQRPAARSVREMRHLQTASRRAQSSQAAQDEV